MLAPDTATFYVNWEAVSARIIVARFQDISRKITVLQCHAPANSDHLYISRRFRRSLLDVSVQSGADATSEHHKDEATEALQTARRQQHAKIQFGFPRDETKFKGINSP